MEVVKVVEVGRLIFFKPTRLHKPAPTHDIHRPLHLCMNPRAMRGGRGGGGEGRAGEGGSDAEAFGIPWGFHSGTIQVPWGGARVEEGETKLAQGIFGDRFVVAQAVELVWISNCVLAVSRPRHSKSIQMEFRTIRERFILQREMGGESVRGFGKE